MVVSSENGITRLLADGQQTVFVYDFEIASVNVNFTIQVEKALGVYLFDGDAQETQQLDVDYSVDAVGNTVTFVVPPPNGTIVTIVLEAELLQETVYQEGGRFPGKSHEAELDWSRRNDISQQNQLNRGVKLIASQATQEEFTANAETDGYILVLDVATQQFVAKNSDDVLDSSKFFKLVGDITPERLIKILSSNEGTSSNIGDSGGKILIYDNGLVFAPPGGVTRALGIDFTVGNYTGVAFSIDNTVLPDNPILGIQNDGSGIRFVAVENFGSGGGGIDLDNPVANRITKVQDGSTIESADHLEEVDDKIKLLDIGITHKDTTSGREVEDKIDLTLGTFDTIENQIDETLLDDDTVIGVRNDPLNPGKVIKEARKIVLSGGIDLIDPVPGQHTVTVDASTIKSSTLLGEVGDKIHVAGDSITYKDTTSGREVESLIDLSSGAYEKVLFSVDENTMVGGEFVRISFDAFQRALVLNAAVPPGDAGLQLDIAIIGRYTYVTGDNSVTSGVLLEGIIDGQKTVFSTAISANTITFYSSTSSFFHMSFVPGTPFKTRWDISPEKVEDGQVVQIVKDSFDEYRFVAVDLKEAPVTQLYHVQPGGGVSGNVPAFEGHQEIDTEKYVDDSALASGAGVWDGVELESIFVRRNAATSASAAINTGEVTIDVSKGKSFFTVFDEDIDVLNIENFDEGSTFLWVLETYGGLDFKITWNADIYFADGLQFQSTALDGEVDAIKFERRNTFWFAEHVLDCVSVTLGEVLILNGADLGNVVTVAGTGLLVQATGETRIDAGTIQKATLSSVLYRRIAYTNIDVALAGGSVPIDVAMGRTYSVDVDDNVLELDVEDNFDRAKDANFTLFCEETDDGFTYNFGADWIYDNSSLPEASVTGGFKFFVCHWKPALQLWYAFRQQ